MPGESLLPLSGSEIERRASSPTPSSERQMSSSTRTADSQDASSIIASASPDVGPINPTRPVPNSSSSANRISESDRAIQTGENQLSFPTSSAADSTAAAAKPTTEPVTNVPEDLKADPGEKSLPIHVSINIDEDTTSPTNADPTPHAILSTIPDSQRPASSSASSAQKPGPEAISAGASLKRFRDTFPSTCFAGRARLRRLRRVFDFTEPKGLLRCLFVLVIASLGIGILVFNRMMHAGHSISFPSDDARQGFTAAPKGRGTISIIWSCASTIFTCVYVSLHLDVPYVEEETGRPGGTDGSEVKQEQEVKEGQGEGGRDLDVPDAECEHNEHNEHEHKAHNDHSEPDEEVQQQSSDEGSYGYVPGEGVEPRVSCWRRCLCAVRTWPTKILKDVSSSSTNAWKEVSSWPTKIWNGVSGWPTKIWRRVWSMKRKAVWVVFNIVAPELVAYVAIVEFGHARWWRKTMIEDCGVTEKDWTLTHQHFADMGGFKAPSEDGDVILRSGVDFYWWALKNPTAFKSINFKQIKLDVDDKCKADSLLKAFTILQASWLVVQTIVRASKGLAVSELEVTTCAYVASAVITYGFWWHKPYGAQKHILLPVQKTSIDWKRGTNLTPFNRGLSFGVPLKMKPIVLSGLIGAIIGAIHCSLWNVSFANSNGQLIWRACSITQVISPLVVSAFLAMREQGRSKLSNHRLLERNTIDDSLMAAALISSLVQFSARFAIFILIGYSFRSLPSSVYQEVDWSGSSFPHWH